MTEWRRSTGMCGAGLCTWLVGWVLTVAPVVVHTQNATPPAPRPVPELRFSALAPDATITVALERGAVAIVKALWIPQRQTSSLVSLDPAANAAGQPIALAAPPCASLATMGEKVWAFTCRGEAGAVVAIDPVSRNISAATPLPVAAPEGALAVAAESLWLVTDAKGVISRVDPATAAAVAEVYVPPGPTGIASNGDELWVSSAAAGVVSRINAQTNVVVATVKVAPRPGPIVVGEGAVWILSRGEGVISRIDQATNKVVATIPMGEAFAEADLAVGEGSVWLSAPGTPLLRIDPRSNRAVQRFVGAGGGAIVVAHGSVWVAAGPSLTWRLDPKLIAAIRPE